MTEPDWDHFAALFVSLCRAFNKPVTGETPKQARDYFDHLTDYPVSVVERAKAEIIRSSKFWPKVRDWRLACDSVRASEPTPYVQLTREAEDGSIERLYVCLRCQDNGWRPACGCAYGAMDYHGMCPIHPRVENGGMVYRQAMEPCECRESNAAYQASRPKVTGAARDAGGGREAA
jgi:hypothetical protein